MPTYTFLYACPNPVGHRVTVIVYSIPKPGLLASGRETCDTEPVVIDRDTGIKYAPPRLYGSSPGSPLPSLKTGLKGLGTTYIAEATLERTEEGVVTECRIFPVA
ncbi:hypothetical protein M427DRAFT_60660 [Gonapodya prolifera JEL478]|uniref:Uncharacterized protein n=1 Tax=Gonapodya prolifera (strain JEL478) TaxID=1344416 RepID=A0A139A3Q0_GONPJ|nr:hypothetical protein M427DRAFT_60660 [Gonapodya prolifera JEL478]|eukprot:KXS11410.1 hypothetical protein M427DRAFT_60660 [Gonapodya prolifera JEL478]